ncbi:MAG TPA: PhzF family phenazine biosynthesis protein [Gammaproteobacteria bacterium]
MELPIYQIDAFTTHLFGGNPAAVCPLRAWLPEATLQAIAAENNLSETAFFVREGNSLRIRWFTPLSEVKLCGHATLAAAWVWFRHIEPHADQVVFDSLSGPLTVTRAGERLTLDFPAQISASLPTPIELGDALGITPLECRTAGEDWLVVLGSATEVRELRPRINLIQQLDCRALIVTAKGDDCDFVSRVFAPKVGIAEDPVTGSAHTKLVPYWADKLGKQQLHARQLSQRGGELFCELLWERVLMSGTAVPYLAGTITLDSTAQGAP